jgi:hypothetical protein
VNRKLILLNVVLLGLVAWAGTQWRNQYLAAKARQLRMRNAKVTPPPMIPPPPIPSQPPVLATSYDTVAQKLLLHPSRNPNIPVDPPPPPPAPEPMPPLPKYHGSMNLDGVATAILSAGGKNYQEIKPGQMIGAFKLIDINTKDITFEWKDQQVRKPLDELLDHTVVDDGNTATTAAAAAAANAAPPPPAIKSQIGPKGETSVFGTRPCDPNDSYPEGAVVDGWRKSSSTNPFGKACFWQPAGK